MKVLHTVCAVAIGLALTGCLVPVEDDPTDSDSSLVEGATEGSNQTTAAATTVRLARLIERDALRNHVSIELGFDARPILTRANEAPGEAARAALELYRALLDERGLSDAAAALNQFLSQDPSNPSGAIAAVGDGSGCSSFGGFFLRGSITEPDPPLARLIVDHDASAGAACRIDGTVHYDLRVAPNTDGGQTITVVMAYPDGLSIQPESGEPFLVNAGGSISMGLAFDSARAFSAVEAGADYCVRRGVEGIDVCFVEMQLAVGGAVMVNIVDGTCATCGSRFGDAFVDGLAGDQVMLTAGTSLGLEAMGAVTRDGLGLTLGNATTPILLEVAFDSMDGWSALLDGELTTTRGANVATYAFSASPGSAGAGFLVTKPLMELSLTLDGCAARTADAETTTACFTDLDLLAEEGDREGSIKVTADGALAYTTPSSDATYTFTAASVDVLGMSAIFDGSVTRTTASAMWTVLFEGFELAWDASTYTVSGVIETREGGTTIVRADFCDGSTYHYDGTTETTTLTGCVSLTSPIYGTLGLGDAMNTMTVTIAPTVSTVDGPTTYDDPSMRRIASITFEGWRAENLEDGTLDVDYHRRVTGRATLDVLGIRGSVESTTGIETLVTSDSDAETQTIQLDGDVAIEIDAGPQTVSGGMVFTGYTATFMEQMDASAVAHLGVVDMDVMLGSSSLLPTSSMRVTFGDGTTPFMTVSSETITTVNGHVLLGVGCRTGTCNQDIDIVLTDVAFETPPCGRQHPHTGMAVISGLDPTTSALIPALRVRCECNGRSGRETLLPRRVTMVFTDATPTDRRIQIPEANGVCGLRLNAMCNEPGAAWLSADSVCME